MRSDAERQAVGLETTQQKAFQETKSPVLDLYNPTGKQRSLQICSCLNCGVLLQSVHIQSTDSRGMQVHTSQEENPCLDLGVCEQCSDYILGKSIITETGHKPIVPFLTKHNLDDVPPRTQCHRMELM